MILPASSFKVEQLKLDASKPTILVCSDSPGIHTGQAQVIRSLFKRIYASGKFNLVQVAWWHVDPVEAVPWHLLYTNKHPDGKLELSDRYGALSLNNVLEQLKPSLVWSLGDPWMLQSLVARRTKIQCPIIAYLPADGGPLPTMAEYTPVAAGWAEVMETIDCIVPLVPSGYQLFKEAFPNANISDPIPCGVDLDIYRPISQEEKNRNKVMLFKILPSDRLMMSVGRNQQRKHIVANIAAMHFLFTGHYTTCGTCGGYTLWDRNYTLAKDIGPAGKCKWCGDSEHQIPGIPRGNLRYYMHIPLDEMADDSYRIPYVLRQFGLLVGNSTDTQFIMTNKMLRSGHGLSEASMSCYYATSDVFALPSFGEGFGCPLLESIACGTPVITPNYSAPPDFVGKAGRLVKVGYQWCEPQTSYWRGMVDLDAWTGALDTSLYKDPISKEACLEVAKQYSWEDIAKKWIILLERWIKSGESAMIWRQALSGV